MSSEQRANFDSQDVYKESISLLLLDTRIQQPKTQTANLRKAGFIVHPRILTDPDKLKQALGVHAPDILICNEGEFNGQQVLQAVAECQPGIPVILVSDERSPQQLNDALGMGARDLVQQDDLGLLTAVFKREVENLAKGRQANRLRQRLAETQQRFNHLIHNSQDAIAYVAEGNHILANPAYLDLFGFLSMDDLIELPLHKLTSQRDHATLDLLLLKLAGNTAKGEIEIGLHSQENRQFDALLSYQPAMLDERSCSQITIKDLTHALETEQRVRLLSDHDLETGLTNRRQFINQLDELIPELRQGRPGNLIYLGIGNMSTIRAKAGEEAATGLLAEIAAVLSATDVESGIFSRLGNHTFALFCRNHDKGAIGKLAEQLSARLQKNAYSTGLPGTLRPEFNLGLAEGSNSLQGAEELIEQAFRACEAARRQGPNCWLWYDDSIDDTKSSNDINRHEQIVGMIDAALQGDRFRLFYQPVVSLQGDSQENYAVLVRMLSSDNQTFLPETFLEHAHSHGRMAAIDRWIIKQAIAELAQQRAGKRKINLFIQLSADTLKDEELLIWICDCLQMYNAKGPWLTFQIADKDIRTNPTRTRELVKGLKRISCRLAITRFGVTAKYESLLKHLPVDLIKLDNSYIELLAKDLQRQKQLAALCKLAKEYGVRVIAGGVEDADSLHFLWDAGVHYIQGYLLQEPVESISYDFNVE